MKYDFVFFHHPCIDGLLSYTLLLKAGLLHENHQIRPSAPDFYLGKNLAEVIKNKNIILVDLNLKYTVLKDIIQKSNKVLFIDHHQNNFENNLQHEKLEIFHTKDKCSSKIVFETFFLSVFKKKKKSKIPCIIELVNDIDLKLNTLKESPYFSAACQVYFNNNITNLNKEVIQSKCNHLFELYSNNKQRKEFIKEGEAFNKYKHSIIKQSLNNFEKIDIVHSIKKKKVKLLVCNQSGLMAKFLANHFQAFSDIDIAIVWYYNISLKGITCIVRSHEDITWLVRQYGGGGLEKAGTFNMKGFKSIYEFIDLHNSK